MAKVITYLSFRVRLKRSMKVSCSSAEVILIFLLVRMKVGSSRMGAKASSVEIPRILNPLEVYITLTVTMRG